MAVASKSNLGSSSNGQNFTFTPQTQNLQISFKNQSSAAGNGVFSFGSSNGTGGATGKRPNKGSQPQSFLSPNSQPSPPPFNNGLSGARGNMNGGGGGGGGRSAGPLYKPPTRMTGSGGGARDGGGSGGATSRGTNGRTAPKDVRQSQTNTVDRAVREDSR